MIGTSFSDESFCDNVQIQVAALDTENLPALARKADAIMAAKRTPTFINASNLPPKKKPPPRGSEKADFCWYHTKFGSKAKSCRPPCTFQTSTGDKHQLSGNGQASLRLLAKVKAVWDLNTGHKLLVDTGAQVSVFPVSAQERRCRQKTEPLVAANGSVIETFGTRNIPVDLGFRQFNWSFVLAAVNRPMLGADFFCSNHLLIDVYTSCIIDAKTYESIPVWRDTARAPGLNTCTASEFADILKEFPSVTRPQISTVDVKHGVEHCIPTSGPPTHAKARRLSPDKLAIARREFAAMEKLGIVRRSSSPWASPLHMVEKKTPGTWRPCGDYRHLNEATAHDQYPVPHIQDFSLHLKGNKIFSKVDLVRGYNQILVAAADVPKTAVITPFGLFEFLRMPFGLRNAAQAFQRFMDQVCCGLEDFLFVYIDDILVASSDAKEHRRHLRLLFRRLADHGLVVNVAKCIFGVDAIDFLGHRLRAQGVELLPERVEAIRQFPQPTDAKALSEFLGMVNFYHRFVPHAAALMGPLHSMSQSAFDATKEALASAVLLVHPSANATTCPSPSMHLIWRSVASWSSSSMAVGNRWPFSLGSWTMHRNHTVPSTVSC